MANADIRGHRRCAGVARKRGGLTGFDYWTLGKRIRCRSTRYLLPAYRNAPGQSVASGRSSDAGAAVQGAPCRAAIQLHRSSAMRNHSFPIDRDSSPIGLGSVSSVPMTFTLQTQRLCARLENGDIDRTRFLEQCTRLVASVVGCSRAGVWVFQDTTRGRTLHCLAMFDGMTDRMTTVQDEAGEHVGTYFQTLERVGYVTATDAQTHFATAGFFADRLKPSGVRSMMAASFAVNGRLFGAFTCSHVGSQVEWSRLQLHSLRQIGARASLALSAYEARTAMDTRPAPLLA
jgi:hypothetical protein